jgi:uncharacterized membrane protein YhaH (DUF805 family)
MSNCQNEVPTMSFGEAIKSCFSKYATFSGRASRAEYWWFFLFTLIVGCIPFLGYVAAVVFFIPNLAVSWRRLHDIGKGGGWYFIALVPLVGPIIYLVYLLKQGERKVNRFGENPYGYNDVVA